MELHRTRRTLAAFKIAFLLRRRCDRSGRGGCVRSVTQAEEGPGVALAFFRYAYNAMQASGGYTRVACPPCCESEHIVFNNYYTTLVWLLFKAVVNFRPGGSARGGKLTTIHRESHRLTMTTLGSSDDDFPYCLLYTSPSPRD